MAVSGDSKTSQVVQDQPRPHPLQGWEQGVGPLGRLLAPCPPHPRHKITGFQAAELEPRATAPLSLPDVVAGAVAVRPQAHPTRPQGASQPTGTRLGLADFCQSHCPSLSLNPPPKERTQSPSLGSKAPSTGFLHSLTQTVQFWARREVGLGVQQRRQQPQSLPAGVHGLSGKHSGCGSSTKSLGPQGTLGARGPRLRDGAAGM